MLMSKRRFRLYLDFAAGSNMAEALMKQHNRWTKINGKDRPQAVANESILPEAFVWHVIKALATACIALENGTLGNDLIDGWKPIMHLNFQTPNVLFDVHSKKRKAPQANPEEPAEAGPSKRLKPNTAPASRADNLITPVLADFDLAFFNLDCTHCRALDENPHEHVFPSATGLTRYPPELVNLNTFKPVRLDAATDIWGIGRIAWSLIVNTLEPDGPVRENGPLDEMGHGPLPLSANQEPNRELDDMYAEQVLVGSRSWPAAQRYGEELKSLVKECLKWEKIERPGAREVLQRADAWLAANGDEALGAMDGGQSWLNLPDDGGFEVGEPFKGRTVKDHRVVEHSFTTKERLDILRIPKSQTERLTMSRSRVLQQN